MKRRILAAICAVLVIWGGLFYGMPDDDEQLVDW